MKKMFKETLLIVVLLSGTLAHGQHKIPEAVRSSTPEQRASALTEVMKQELTLSDDQVPRIHEVNLKYAELAEAEKDKNTSKREKFSRVKELDMQKEADLKPVLTDDQLEEYSKHKKDYMQKMIEKLEE